MFDGELNVADYREIKERYEREIKNLEISRGRLNSRKQSF